jgi:hypothetical protein
MNEPQTAIGEVGARLRALIAIRDRVKSIQGCDVRQGCAICNSQLAVILEDLDALLSAPVGSPPLERAIVAQAMAALESDATLDQRREAWNALRDHFWATHET